ncbi:hypothetical protein GA0074695_1532 [Micromonospora viridifaciens]|uniref:Uncharacterized protein n=1 Tax=Micromonospora viridifaciens TaxID=1881 RepID=A0A1C4VJI6_MICVI|nr:hypothetical protein [Micromonospora viridifaciens]SCE84167.1 hypothetical protein GA0074695_1532 [Micromonospora viridifaciens]
MTPEGQPVTAHPRRPDAAAVARALAEAVAASHIGTLHLTRARLVAELTAWTGYPWAAEEAAPAVHAAAPVLAEAFGVYVAHVREPGGWRWRVSVRPYATP